MDIIEGWKKASSARDLDCLDDTDKGGDYVYFSSRNQAVNLHQSQ